MRCDAVRCGASSEWRGHSRSCQAWQSRRASRNLQATATTATALRCAQLTAEADGLAIVYLCPGSPAAPCTCIAPPIRERGEARYRRRHRSARSPGQRTPTTPAAKPSTALAPSHCRAPACCCPTKLPCPRPPLCFSHTHTQPYATTHTPAPHLRSHVPASHRISAHYTHLPAPPAQ